MDQKDQAVTSQVGPVQVDWPRSAGYFGGIGLAFAIGMIEAPIAIFIAAIPFIKMLEFPNSPMPVRIVSQVLDGASKPVGGDGEATIQMTRSGSTGGSGRSRIGRETKSIWSDAKLLARGEAIDGSVR